MIILYLLSSPSSSPSVHCVVLDLLFHFSPQNFKVLFPSLFTHLFKKIYIFFIFHFCTFLYSSNMVTIYFQLTLLIIFLFSLFIQRGVPCPRSPVPSWTSSPPTARLLVTIPSAPSLSRQRCRSDTPFPRVWKLPNLGGRANPFRTSNGTEPGVRQRGRRHERPVPPGGPGRLPDRAEGGHTEGAERAGRGWDDTDLVGRLPRPPGGTPAHRRERVSLVQGQGPSSGVWWCSSNFNPSIQRQMYSPYSQDPKRFFKIRFVEIKHFLHFTFNLKRCSHSQLWVI